jgi:hypothetical protein
MAPGRHLLRTSAAPWLRGVSGSRERPNHPDRDEFLEWYGSDGFQPEVMDADAIESKLHRIRMQLGKGPQKQRSSRSR